MAEAFLGEIRIFAGDFAPRGWAFCNGESLPIQMNVPLFSILGTTYGGNGQTYFNLPDLRDRTPLHAGSGDGLTPRHLGETGGSATVTLHEGEMPSHTHAVVGSTSIPGSSNPVDSVWAGSARSGTPSFQPTPTVQMAPTAIQAAGGGLPHNNRQPYLGLSFIIALQGEFPARD